MRNLIKKIIKEELEKDKTIICNNCGWSWKLSEGGDDPFVCHKCLSNDDNGVTIKEELEKTPLISVGDIFRVKESGILVMIDKISCNPDKVRVIQKYTIFGSHEVNHDGCDVYYVRSDDGGETWEGDDDNYYTTELNWIPFIIENGHWKLLHRGNDNISDFFPE
jgi:hypothetical protein